MKDIKQITTFFLTLLFTHCCARYGETTTYDGVTTNYNRYLEVNGSTGIYYQNPVSGIDTYTMTLWVKLQSLPVNTRKDMTVLSFSPDAFSLSFTIQERLVGTADRGGSITVDGKIRTNNWYVIVLRSNQSSTSLQIRELSFITFSSNSFNGFFPFRNERLSFDNFIIGIS